jgi:hypothetical protein
MRYLCACLFFYVAVSGYAFSQDSRADLFGGYSYLNIDTNGLSSRQNANGWETSISGNFNKWFAAEAAVSGYYKNYDILGINVAVQDYSYVAGPRINVGPIFVHALLGGDHLSAGALGTSASQDGLAGAFGGGVQWRFSKQLSFRVSADYALSRHNILGGSSVTQNNVRASVGIVYSFGVRGVQQQSAPAKENGMVIPALGVRVTTPASGGAEIVEVAPNGVAQLAGLNVEDVIHAVDGTAINSAMELAAKLSSLAPGTQVKLVYMVHGEWQAETVVILR